MASGHGQVHLQPHEGQREDVTEHWVFLSCSESQLKYKGLENLLNPAAVRLTFFSGRPMEV